MGPITRFRELVRSHGGASAVRHAGRYTYRRLLSATIQVSNRLRYGPVAPHPAELIRVDPDQITHEIPYDQKSKLIPYPFATVGLLRYTSYILHGDWDRTRQPLSDPNIEYRKLLHESFDLRYGRGMSWETTPLYERRDDLLEDPQSAFDRWDALYERLQQEGYRPQAELPSKDRLAISPWSDEVAIAITRGGDLLRVTQEITGFALPSTLASTRCAFGLQFDTRSGNKNAFGPIKDQKAATLRSQAKQTHTRICRGGNAVGIKNSNS